MLSEMMKRGTHDHTFSRPSNGECVRSKWESSNSFCRIKASSFPKESLLIWSEYNEFAIFWMRKSHLVSKLKMGVKLLLMSTEMEVPRYFGNLRTFNQVRDVWTYFNPALDVASLSVIDFVPVETRHNIHFMWALKFIGIKTTSEASWIP